MRRILIITRDEVEVTIVKPNRPLYGARYDHILVDPEGDRKDPGFFQWVQEAVRCRTRTGNLTFLRKP